MPPNHPFFETYLIQNVEKRKKNYKNLKDIPQTELFHKISDIFPKKEKKKDCSGGILGVGLIRVQTPLGGGASVNMSLQQT